MDYRCHVRTLLRTVGLVAGLTLCASAQANEAATTGRGNTTSNSVSPQTEEFGKGKQGAESTMLPGGGGEEQGGQVGQRANPCSLPATNCYDRQAGTAPYFQVICGQFNASRFLCADNFIPSAADSVTTVCWRGWWSPDPAVCDAPSNPPGVFHIDFYNDSGLGLPGSSISSYTEGVDLTVTQGETGDPVGFNNPTQFEVGFSAVLGASQAVSAGTCYWVEIDWDKNTGGGQLDTCFFEIGQSYEKIEGDRRMVRRDESTGNPYQESDAINRDIMLCIGFVNGTTVLNDTNTAPCYPGGGGPSPRTAPGNDEIAGNTLVLCGTPALADNTYATTSAGFGDPSCRIVGLDPTNYVSNDVFFRFATGAGVTSAVISTCNSPLLGGQAPGDSILQLYSNATYTTQIGCNDNGCGVLSQILATGLTQNTTYYIRLASINAGTAGKYTLTVDCPIVVPANDLCTGAATIATTGSPSTLDLAGVNTAQVTTAICTVDGQFSGCPGAANTANSVWYKLVGGGNPIQLSTDQPVTGLTPYDTRLSVYCSNDGTCNVGQLNCVAANDDIDAQNSNFASEVEFCALSGKTYYVLLHGFGTSTGAAIVNARSLRDENTQALLTCCDTQVCTFTCTFEVPCGANDEVNASASYNNAGWALVGLNAEPCDNTNDQATNANSGPNPPVNTPPKYGKLVEGVAMKGSAWSTGGVRDADWWIFHGVTNSDTDPTMVSYTAQFTGPCTQFVSQSRGANFSTNVFSGLGQLSGFAGTSFCGQTLSYRYNFSHPNGTGGTPLATNLDTTTPGAEMTWRFRLVQLGAGYPCGTNTDYWVRVDWALPTASCTAVTIPGGADDETTALAFSGNAGGEACGVDTMDGCGHTPTVTDDFFTRLQVGVPMTGTMFGSVGSGASIDGESFKVAIAARSVVRMHVDSSGPTSMGITNDDCTVDAIGYGVAASRGSCFPGGVNAEDLFILDAGTYQVNVFSNDAFGSFPSGIFVNVACTNPTQRYVINLTATAVDVCSPVCAGATAESETACEEFGTECTTDNDGCSEGFFQATASGLTVGSSGNLSGTIFTTFDPPPLGTATYTSDVDYWQFTVAVNARLTFNIVSNGPIFGLVADTGVGGVNCLDLVNGVRVLGSINATSCSGGSPASRTVFLTPGTYCIVVAGGSVETGTNATNLGEDTTNCTGALQYCISATLAQVGSCCTGSDCTITSQAECAGTWDGNATCGNGYTVGALDASCSGFSSIASVPNQLTNFLDEEVRQVAIPAFKFYGTTYTQLGVGSNGYVELIPSGGASTGSGARARQFPNTALPNAIVAPFWRDWEPNAPGAAVYIQTSGGVTTVEWNNVAKFNDWNKRASFQVRLTHADNSIEFRYGTFTGLTCEELDSFAVGAEGLSGLNGAAYANASGFLNGSHCLKLTPTGTGNPCAVPVCCFGNAAKDSPGTVNFADVTAVLANFGGAGPIGDADCNGVVNFADITSVLANFGNLCP